MDTSGLKNCTVVEDWRIWQWAPSTESAWQWTDAGCQYKWKRLLKIWC